MEQNVVKESVDILLSKLLNHSERFGYSIGNILSLEKIILQGVLLLEDEEKQYVLYALLKADYPILSFFGLSANNHRQIIKLIQNLSLFSRNGYLDSFFLSKLLEEFLIDCAYQKGQDVEDVSEIEKIMYQHDDQYRHQEDLYDYDYWRFGSRNKKRLGLSKKEVRLLNKIAIGDTVFTKIEQCGDETAKLYLRVIQNIEKLYQSKGDSFSEKIDRLERTYSYGYGYGDEYLDWDSPVRKIFNAFLKFCENGLREKYRHKRKLKEKLHFEKLQELLSGISYEEIKEIIEIEKKAISPAGKETLIELNAINKTRWKDGFQEIKTRLKELSPKEILQELDLLYRLNAKNPNLSGIYFESSKVLIDVNKIAALKAYLNYWFLASKDSKAKIKSHSKNQIKKLFKNEEQLAIFVQIIGRFSIDKDVKAAIKDLPSIYAIKRKEVKLDDSSISRINEMHTETVEKLSQVLDEPIEIKHDESNEKHTNESEAFDGLESIFDSGDKLIEEPIEFKDYQLKFIQFLMANNSFLDVEAIHKFAKEHGVFKNQLINGINELFYEVYEDNLLKEEEQGCKIIAEYIDEVKKLENVN